MARGLENGNHAALRSRAGLAVLAWGLLGVGCSPSRPVTTLNLRVQVPTTAGADALQTKTSLTSDRSMASQLRELRARLDTVTQCKDTCCAKGYTEFGAVSGDEPALREVLKSNAPAPVRGLAAIHLRHLSHHDLDLVADLDSCVGLEQPAGIVPDDSEPQQIQSWCPGTHEIYQRSLAWSPHTLGELCLETANAVTSMNMTIEQYRVWRARYANAKDSIELWHAKFRSRHPIDDDLLADLESHSRELYVRALLTCPEGLSRLGLDPSRIASRLPGTFTSKELLALLENPTPWPELSDTERRDALARNLFTYWRVLLGAEAATRLEALWNRGFANNRPLVRYDLALAVADAVPVRRRTILKQGLGIPSVDPARALEQLAAEYASEEEELLAQWIKPPLASESSQVAILDGLARADPPQRHLFRTLLGLLPVRGDAQDAAANAALISHAVAAAEALGCSLPHSTCEKLSPWTGKRAVSRKEREDEHRRAEGAQHECYAALLRCSASW